VEWQEEPSIYVSPHVMCVEDEGAESRGVTGKACLVLRFLADRDAFHGAIGFPT